MSTLSKIRDNKGLTLVELIVAVAVFAIIIPIIVTVFGTVTKSFTSYEAAIGLRKINQDTQNKIYLRLVTSKRIFQNIPTDNSYLSSLLMTNDPPLLQDARLPGIEQDGSLSPSSSTFISASVGNSIFFANNESIQILENIADSLSVIHTVRINCYRFNYYYLTSENPKPIFDAESYCIVEWRSIEYADSDQIMSILDNIERANTVKALVNSGITFCWSSSAVSTDGAFFSLSAAGNIIPSPSHNIQKHKCVVLPEKMITGIIGGGYRYGISPNSANWSRAPKVVPVYATASNKFPGGFEVVIVGRPENRNVLLRSVLVAQGSMANIIGDDLLVMCKVTDMW